MIDEEQELKKTKMGHQYTIQINFRATHLDRESMTAWDLRGRRDSSLKESLDSLLPIYGGWAHPMKL